MLSLSLRCAALQEECTMNDDLRNILLVRRCCMMHASPDPLGLSHRHALSLCLQTYCFYRPDVGYVQGMSYLAGNFLLYSVRDVTCE